MNILQKLKEYCLDLAPLGLMAADDSDRYFCTPADAKMLFRTGVDGIHYCQLDGFGETVFAVEPMGDIEEQVYPVAESAEDFLRLVIACGGEAAVQQCKNWDRGQFESFLAEYPPAQQQQSCIQRLTAELALTPMDDPFGYVSIVQNGFDDQGHIRFTEEYYEILGLTPPCAEETVWTVTYTDGIYSEPPRGDDVGAELPVQIGFRWAERDWYIPSVYLCREGLVADVCQRAERTALQAFIGKWNLLENDGRNVFSEEQELQINRENPLGFDYRMQLTVNGAVMHSSEATGITWNPCVPDHYYRDTETVKRILSHYALDDTYGWSIRRICYPWPSDQPSALEHLTMTLTAAKADYIAGRFCAEAGSVIALEHPITKERYTLKVCEQEQQTLNRKHMPDDDTEYPLCYTAIQYELTPPVDKQRIQLRDTRRGDSPIHKGRANGGVSAIAVLREDSAQHIALSALTFEPQNAVEWAIIFHETEYTPITVTLIE